MPDYESLAKKRWKTIKSLRNDIEILDILLTDEREYTAELERKLYAVKSLTQDTRG